ncbi:MAG: hypothetical protein ABJN35_03585 [Erythrobacter sp.]
MSILAFATAALMAPLGDTDAVFDCLGGERDPGKDWSQIPETLDKAFSFRVNGLRTMFESDEVDNEIAPPSDRFVFEGHWFDPDGVSILRVNSEYDQISLHGQEYTVYFNEPLAKGWVVAAGYNRVSDDQNHSFVCHATLGWEADISDYNSQEAG